ncbi:MAG: indolepyruvate ferredoxin oxidoreductase subunit alpha [Promethearchaeia archaeon]
MSKIYEELMLHLSKMAMNCPPNEILLNILKKILTEKEVKILLSIPSQTIPFRGISFKELLKKNNFSEKELSEILKNLSSRGIIFSYKNDNSNEIHYALQQVAYGFPQIFFWKGEINDFTKDMAINVIKYFNHDITKEIYCIEPIPFRYLPVEETIEPQIQAIYPFFVMKEIINNAKKIAVSHCICRMTTKLVGRDCGHPTEVCMKFNELAEFLIDKGIGREVSKEEALKISENASKAGLVHFTDNCIENVLQNCNCCGCSCWNLGRIRRRIIPRDEIIATYFIRETIQDKCIGCGNCLEICPADAIKIENGKAIVDNDWCIGCGVCIYKCKTEAIKIVLREDLKSKLPENNFNVLHQKILEFRQKTTKGVFNK